MKVHKPGQDAFTLIELLTVIAIIAVLMSLFMAVFSKVKESAKQASAKNDLVAIVGAVNSFYSDYGVYPITPPTSGSGTEVTFASDNSDLMYTLRGVAEGANTGNVLNPKVTVYLDVPGVKNPLSPKSGIFNGIWYDPWGPQPGKPESGVYHVRIDGSYSNMVSDPYPVRGGSGGGSGGGGGSGWGPPPPPSTPSTTVPLGVIAWSLAATGVQTYELQDQVLSWR
jgi:prepilin-type N-terminal cleavage/methylation domain-containing protein